MSSVPGWVWFSSVTFAAAGYYLWWRLVGQTTRPGTWPRRLGTVVAVLVALASPVALLSQFMMPMGFQRIVGWPAWTGYAVLVCVGFVTVCLEPVRLVAWWRRRRRARAVTVVPASAGAVPTAVGEPAPTATDEAAADGGVPRRLVLERGLAIGALAVGTTMTGLGFAGALGTPRVRRQTIAIRNLPDEAVGTRIALISDLHVGALTTAPDTRRIVDLVNAQNPDIVCLAGDFSDGSPTDLGVDLQPLAELRPTEGTFFVTGNHEYYFDPQGWLDFFPTVGVQVLANENVEVRGMLLAGTHDPQGAKVGMGPDVGRALAGRRPGQPTVLLSHNPVVLDDAIAADVDLLLSGHTHGGQFIPGVWIVGLTTKTLSGHYTFGDTQVFVTNGCRFWGPVARLAAPMDVTVLELVRA